MPEYQFPLGDDGNDGIEILPGDEDRRLAIFCGLAARSLPEIPDDAGLADKAAAEAQILVVLALGKVPGGKGISLTADRGHIA